MYSQVCMHLNIMYITRMLDNYLSNLGIDHYRVAKRLMWYLKRTRDYMLTYKRSDQLQIIAFFDSDFVVCKDIVDLF